MGCTNGGNSTLPPQEAKHFIPFQGLFQSQPLWGRIFTLSESPTPEYYLRKVSDKIEGPHFGSYLIMRIRMTVSASKSALLLTVLCILLASTYGCGTACIVGSAASVGAGAAEAGVTRFEMGRVTRFEIAQ
jgi:hypothetical protein